MKARFLLIMLLIAPLYTCPAQFGVENIVPKPRQAYVRQQFSAVFSLAGKKIYLNKISPRYDDANKLNSLLLFNFIDSLPIETTDNYNEPGIYLDTYSDFINSAISATGDQNIKVTASYPGREGYVLDVLPSRIVIAGSDSVGLYYGCLSMIQVINKINMKNTIFAMRVVDAPEMPNRWIYYPTNFKVANNSKTARKIWGEAAGYKLNGVNVTDYKFEFISDQPKSYFDSLVSLKKFADDLYLRFIPAKMPFGYSNSLMFFNPNFATGLPVKGQKFTVNNGIAELTPRIDVSLINGGFEDHKGDNFTGYTFIDSPGIYSFADSQEKHSGNLSIRFDKFDGIVSNARIMTLKKVSPMSYYHISAYVKTENMRVNDVVKILVTDTRGKQLNYSNISVPTTTNGWQKVEFCFNSLNADTVRLYWGAWGMYDGKIWWDDLAIEEVPFVNMIRRDGAPIKVANSTTGELYKEGIDFDSLVDPKTGRANGYGGDFDLYHQPPALTIKNGGAIKNGDILDLSYYNATIVYDGSVAATMSEPALYDQMDKEHKVMEDYIHPDCYFLGHDELRVMNWDYGDSVRNLKPAEILADNVKKCAGIIRKYSPGVELWDWSDMFDENHNAKDNYYLVNGSLKGGADLIANDIGIMNWNSDASLISKSIKSFADKGFRQMGAAYYDGSQYSIINWKDQLKNVPNALGMMYTTWENKYSYMRTFSEYAWNHAPYIYHNPPMPASKLNLPFYYTVKIVEDVNDYTWFLSSASINYRTDPTAQFTTLPLKVIIGIDTTGMLNLPGNAKFVEYYFLAKDVKGWETKIPYGDKVYFVIGDKPVSVEEQGRPAVDMSIAPNPASNDARLTFNLKESGETMLLITDALGRVVEETNAGWLAAGINEMNLNFGSLDSGIYYAIIKSNGGSSAVKVSVAR